MALYFRDNISGSSLFFADPEASLTPVFSIDSVSAGPYYEGDTVTLQVSNANATGKTLSISAGAITVSAQDANSMSFVVPDLKTFGDRTGRYNSQITFTATDAGVTSTIQLTISPLAGHDYTGTIALAGIHAPAYAPGAATNDNAYGYFVTGSGTSNLAAGAIQSDDGATYRVWYQDESDGVWSSTYADHVIDGSADTTAPVITLLGDALITHPHGTAFVDAGYTATDNNDGDITASVVVTGNINSNSIGTYVRRYNVTDSAGNPATEVTRTINVTDQAPPVIILNGSSTINLALGQVYEELGAIAIDAVDGDLTDFIDISGTVDVNSSGTYSVIYSSTDSAGNNATTIRTVNVAVDITAPVITLVGSSPVTHPQGTAYSDAGATASDNTDGDISSSIVTTGASFNTNVVGSYTVRYNVTDAAGNPATEVTRTVNVVDQINPVISVTPSSLTILLGSAYTDTGVTATDNNDGDITGSIATTGSVDVNTLGSYTLSYSVTDAAGNVGTASRVVTVAADGAVIVTYTTPKYLMLVTESRNYTSTETELSIPTGTYTFTNDGTFIPDAPSKDPASTIDYGVYWTNWLAVGDTIAASEWLLDDGLTSVTQSSSDTETAIMLSGGVAGTLYNVVNRITTSAGRTEERSMFILCENR